MRRDKLEKNILLINILLINILLIIVTVLFHIFRDFISIKYYEVIKWQ